MDKKSICNYSKNEFVGQTRILSSFTQFSNSQQRLFFKHFWSLNEALGQNKVILNIFIILTQLSVTQQCLYFVANNFYIVKIMAQNKYKTII